MPEQLSSYLKSEFHEIYQDDSAPSLALFLDQYMGGILTRGSEGISTITPDNVEPETIIGELQEWWNARDENQEISKPQLLALFDTLFLLKRYSKQLPKLDILGVKGLIGATLGGESLQLFSEAEMQRIKQNDLRMQIDYEITGHIHIRGELMTASDGLDHTNEIETQSASIRKLQADRLEYLLPKPARLRLVEIMGQNKLSITDALTALKQEPAYFEPQ